MPSSNPESIEIVVSVAYRLSPRSVLDVGAGSGKYGVLFREYIENRHAESAREAATTYIPGQRRTVQIDAVEGYAPYIGRLHEVVYDRIFNEDVVQFVKRDFEYDFIYMGDVLEHLDRDIARTTVLPRLIAGANMGVLVSVPAVAEEQGPVYGNELEQHRSVWSASDLTPLAPYSYAGKRGNHLLVFLTRDADSFRIIYPGSWMRRKMRDLRRGIWECLRATW